MDLTRISHCVQYHVDHYKLLSVYFEYPLYLTVLFRGTKYTKFLIITDSVDNKFNMTFRDAIASRLEHFLVLYIDYQQKTVESAKF